MARRELPWKDAIEQVLRANGGGPMHYVDITDAIVEGGLRQSMGATPSFTVSANFVEDRKRGNASRFVQLGRGIYGLRSASDGQMSALDIASSSLNLETDIEPGIDLAPRSSRIAIKAYGMYWERTLVEWSRSTPRLLGQQYQNADPVDHYEQRGLYVLYDHRTVVYAGRATAAAIGIRLKDHTVDRLRSRWDRFSWFGFRGVLEDGALTAAGDEIANLDEVLALMEAVLIELLEPPQNRQQGKGLTAIEYLQGEDPELERRKQKALMAEMIERLSSEK